MEFLQNLLNIYLSIGVITFIACTAIIFSNRQEIQEKFGSITLTLLVMTPILSLLWVVFIPSFARGLTKH